jgi:hypothetical protein
VVVKRPGEGSPGSVVALVLYVETTADCPESGVRFAKESFAGGVPARAVNMSTQPARKRISLRSRFPGARKFRGFMLFSECGESALPDLETS